jgi:hypothetical protein
MYHRAKHDRLYGRAPSTRWKLRSIDVAPFMNLDGERGVYIGEPNRGVVDMVLPRLNGRPFI